MVEKNEIMTVEDISRETSFKVDDVICILNGLEFLQYWGGGYLISVDLKTIEEHLKAFKNQKIITIDRTQIKWKRDH